MSITECFTEENKHLKALLRFKARDNKTKAGTKKYFCQKEMARCFERAQLLTFIYCKDRFIISNAHINFTPQAIVICTMWNRLLLLRTNINYYSPRKPKKQNTFDSTEKRCIWWQALLCRFVKAEKSLSFKRSR